MTETDARPISHWWIPNTATLADVVRSADLALEQGGARQWFHFHAEGEPCDTPEQGESCREHRPVHGGIVSL